MSTSKEKGFKAVEFMRVAREKLSEKYTKDASGFRKDLATAKEEFMAARKQNTTPQKRKRA